MARLTKEHRKEQILQEAKKLVDKSGLYTRELTFSNLSKLCGCSRGNIKYHWKSLQAIRGALIAKSFNGDRKLFSEALATCDPDAVSLQNDAQ